jgi:hypothetical protein
VESATTAQVPARTGAFEACKTTSVLACAKMGDSTAQAKLVSKKAMKEFLLRFDTCFSRQSGFLTSGYASKYSRRGANG